MVTIKVGDIFTSEMSVLVNTVNCVGIMGKGIALIFRKRYPELFEDYETRCERNEVKPGVPYLYENILLGYKVINFPTKAHWRASTRIADIERGLEHFCANYKEWGIESVAFPPLGCGNGGLKWEVVGPLMYSRLKTLDIDIEIFAPHGTSANHLKHEFLNGEELMLADKGEKLARLRDEWVVIAEIVYRIEELTGKGVKQPGFQTICYLATALGIDTGLRFKRSSYRAESRELKEMINVLSNRNWLLEERRGLQFLYRPGLAYRADGRRKSPNAIVPFEAKIRKIAQLFRAPLSSLESELIAATIFHIQRLKQNAPDSTVTRKSLINAVCSEKIMLQKPENRTKVEAVVQKLQAAQWIRLADESASEDAEQKS
jgi:O-acetyl-ADP-ribose deacetylase (regulator of RNase III)